jgi:hypothetical protein
MARAQTLKKEPWRKYKTNTSITVYQYLKIDGHTETPLVVDAGEAAADTAATARLQLQLHPAHVLLSKVTQKK